MKIINKHSALFKKIILSYTLLALIMTAIIGSIAFLHFSSNFNKEIIQVNGGMLDNINHIIEETLLKRTEKIYISMASQMNDNLELLDFLENSPSMHTGSLINVYHYLKKIAVSNTDILDSIEIFSVGNNVIISSLYGIKYLTNDNIQQYPEAMWIKRIENSNLTFEWTGTQKSTFYSSEPIRVFSFLKTYPYTAKGKSSKGFFSFNVRETALNEIISVARNENKSSGQIFIIDQNGSIISHSDKDLLYNSTQYKADLQRIIKSFGSEGSFIETITGIKSMVSYSSLKSVPWKIVRYVSVAEFYTKSNEIGRVLLLVCLVTFMLGLFIANIFTRNFYNPLKNMVTNIRLKLLGSKSSEDYNGDEYAIINTTINGLSSKVWELERMLEDNKSLIRYNLVIRLLNRTIQTETEYDQRMKLAGIKMGLPLYTSVLVDLDSNYIKKISLDNCQLIRYNLMSWVEYLSKENLIFLPTELSDSRMVIISNSCSESLDALIMHMDALIKHAKLEYTIDITAYIGPYVPHAIDLHRSYDKALEMVNYKFFLPDIGVLTCQLVADHFSSKDELPKDFIDNYLDGLKLLNFELVKQATSTLVKQIINGRYSLESCNHALMEVVTSLSRHVRNLGYNTQDILDIDLLQEFQFIGNINEYHHWIISVTEKIIQYIINKKLCKNSDIIERVKEYVIGNINGDLSLNAIAEKIFMSAPYLSRIFKEETGVTFSDYITEKRFEKAQELILHSKLSIKEIAVKTGFGSSRYFISTYKKKYGVTPNNYRTTYLKML